MKKLVVCLTLAGLAMVATLQAGEKSDKSACCASTQAKGTTCTAKQASAKSTCCAKSMAAKKVDPTSVRGGMVLMQLSKR